MHTDAKISQHDLIKSSHHRYGEKLSTFAENDTAANEDTAKTFRNEH